MATPYIVPKISLTKTANEFDHCNGEGGSIASCTANVPNISSNSCRLTCSSWCPMCERKTASSQHDSLTKSLVDGLRKVDSGIHDGLKNLQPVMSKLNSQVISENISHKFSSLSQKASLFVSSPKDLKLVEPSSPRRSENCVHEKYVKEVEALKGKIQELRENLNRQFSESENIITSIPKLIWNKESSECNLVERPNDHGDCVPYNISEYKRSKRLSESENTSGPGVVFQKRPRDISPELNATICDNLDLKRPENGVHSQPTLLNKTNGLNIVNVKELNFSNGYLKQEKVTSPYPNKALFPLESNANKQPHSAVSRSIQGPNKTLKDSTTSEIDNADKELVKNFLYQGQVNFKDSESSLSYSSKSSLKDKGILKYVPLKSVKYVDRNTLHPALRSSLFPMVPPYIQFISHDTQVDDPLPPAVSKVLRWRITTITPLVVRKTVLNSGFKLVKQSPEWTGTWGKHMKSVMFRTIREDQKINHFPGTFQIGRKDKLWKNLHHLMVVFSKREFGFIPRTYILPQDMKMLRIAWERDGGNDSMWIVKPPASARGTGIKVVNKWTQIPKKTPIIVQKYISNPYLINGNKFDLRLYALVTSFNPLRIYLYDNGLVRFASVKYSEDLNSLSDRYMHLTNYSINKLSNNYHHNEDADACQGHKWTIKTLFTYLHEKVDVKALWERLVDLVIKTTLCGESSICNLSKNNLTSHYCSYELFGVDVLLDENLTPWLLEVNISPSLHSASPLDLAVKGPLIKDILNIAGYQIPDKLNDTLKNELRPKLGIKECDPICFNKDLYIAGLSSEEKIKQRGFIEVERPEYLKAILKNLTSDDIRHLIRYEDELTQIGSFEKIFPTAESHEYLKYFESPQYYNKLFDAWETKYSNDRTEGVTLLQALCSQGHHLNVDDVTLHVSVSASELAEPFSESTVASDVSEDSQRLSVNNATEKEKNN